VPSFAKLTSFFAGTFTNLLGRNASAATSYDYGFPLYGFSEAELGSALVEDPYANGEYIESGDRLEVLNNEYGNECFGMTISGSGQLIYDKSVDFRKIPEKCKSDNSDLLRYRFYLADMVNAHSLACYEGVYESCSEISSTGPDASIVPTTGSSDPGQDTSNLQCPAGTEDGGVHQDYGPGQIPTVKIRICGIPGAIAKENGVNASLAGQALAMIEAMRATGLTPSGSAFRSYDTQWKLRVANCPDPVNSSASSCRPPTAKPGTSMHEVGLAIDFRSMCFTTGGSSSCPGNKEWEWLVDNAATYGFQQLRSEAWHWSPSGS
jgi:hypothetical protein